MWAKNVYVSCDTALKMVTLPTSSSGSGGVGGGKYRKRLGDMEIEVDGSSDTTTTLLADTIKRLEKCKEEMINVIMTGGRLSPGQSFDPVTVVKGISLPNRQIGRNWLEPDEWYYHIPTVDGRNVPDGDYKSYGTNNYNVTPRYNRGSAKKNYNESTIYR